MKTKMVRYSLDTLPPLTEAQRENLKTLAARPTGSIDTSDAPEMTDAQWKSAERGQFYRPVKRQITARVDADVLEWLRAQGQRLPVPDQRDPAAGDACVGENFRGQVK